MLKNHGVNDLWLLRTGEEKGQISLGVFNKEEKGVNNEKSDACQRN